MQKAAAEKRLSKKENPVNPSNTGHATLGENDLPTTKVVGEMPPTEGIAQVVNNEENACKRKEVSNPSKEKATKRPRIIMPASKKKSVENEIFGIELHEAVEPGILNLYAGATIVAPNEKDVEEVQEEVKEFISQVSTKINCDIIIKNESRNHDATMINASIEVGQ